MIAVVIFIVYRVIPLTYCSVIFRAMLPYIQNRSGSFIRNVNHQFITDTPSIYYSYGRILFEPSAKSGDKHLQTVGYIKTIITPK